LFLLGAAAIAIPVALHLLRRRTEDIVDFPAIRLLKNVPVEQHRRRRLRELVLLALRISALVLLALSFARPYMQSAAVARAVPVTVVVLDTSLSMSAPGQFERAREAARGAIERAPATHHVALVTFSDNATLIVPPTADRGGVATALGTVSPGPGGTRFRTALARAAEAITAAEGAIVIVTDLQQTGWDAADEGAVPDGIGVEVIDVPSPTSNLAVTALRRDGDALVAAVHNFGPQARRIALRLRVEGNAPVAQSVDVGPHAAADVRFPLRASARGSAEVSVDDPEGYGLDNARYLSLDPPPAVPVIVITAAPPNSSDAGLYVERALQVAGDGSTYAARIVDGRGFDSLAPDELTRAGALVVLGTSTLTREGRGRIAQFIGNGGRALLTLGPDVDVATLADTIGTRLSVDPAPVDAAGRGATMVAVDTRHPVFRPFASPSSALGDVQVERYRRLNVDATATVLARFSGGADALIEQPVGSGRLLVFASDLDNAWNRFPLNAAFVPWLVETARYLVQGREQGDSYVLPHVPGGIPHVPGVHRLDNRPITVNTDVRESNPARMEAQAFISGISRVNAPAVARAAAEAREQEERQRLWQIGLLVMFVALAVEGFIGRKAI
jgi:hypothetical protein